MERATHYKELQPEGTFDEVLEELTQPINEEGSLQPTRVQMFLANIYLGLYKVLGGCVYCNGFYVAFLLWLAVNQSLTVYIIPYLGMSEVFIQLLNHYLNNVRKRA